MPSASEVILQLSVWSRRETTAGSWKSTAVELGSFTGRELNAKNSERKVRLLISGFF
jgi:hypothetical protein